LDPVDGISKREWRENLDYVDSEGIETLRKMSTVNMDDFYDVRDRLLCFGFCYDFALRIGEASLLRCTDVVINDMVELTLRGETQKGRKPDILMFNFFAETKTLLSQYLTLRTRLGAGTDMLFVSMSREPLRAGGCYEAVRAHCKNLGILTHEGHPVAPHRLRHSFGTLNVAPLGANLDVYSIMQRLRHASYDVTTRIYITSNPLLSRARHEQACRRMNSGNSVISQTVVSPVQPVLQAHVAGGVGEVGGDKIREVEALRDVKKLGITVEGLRKYAAEKKYAVKVSGEWFYQASWIAELRSEYTVKAAAIAATGLSRAGYAKWVATRGLSTLVIGKASLIRSSDLLREMASLRKGKGDGMGKGKSKSK
jgi:hypothetical protein